MTPKPVRPVRVWWLCGLIALMLLVVLTGCPGPSPAPSGTGSDQKPQQGTPSSQPEASAPAAQPVKVNFSPQSSKDWIERSMRATVKVWVVKDADKNGKLTSIAGCSGVIVDPSGIILTNWHCVGIRNSEKEDISGQHLRPGEMYNSDGLIVVGLTEDPKQEPRPTYLARVRQGSPDFDIAVAKIFATMDNAQSLPRSLGLTVVPLGDSDTLKIGDPIHVFGYPGVGGSLITETSGQISGYYKTVKGRPDIPVDAFKTDATIGAGNSGGLAVNDVGEDIGIPSLGFNNDEGDTLWGGVLINLTKPFIEKARNDAFDPLPPRLPASPKNPQPSPSPSQQPSPQPAGSSSFSGLVFGTDIQQDKVVGQSTKFPTGSKQVVAVFQAKGLRSGTPWGYVLTIDGEAAVDKGNQLKWSSDPDGPFSITFGNGNQALPDGNYALSLFINGSAALKGSFSVGGGAQPPKQPQPSQGQGATVKGQVVDADTGKPIASAYFVILKAGVTTTQFEDSDFDEKMMAAAAETNADGSFRTQPPVAPGQTYSIIVVARGYKDIMLDNALKLEASDTGDVALKPIRMQKS